jgi:hypothetical protein
MFSLETTMCRPAFMTAGSPDSARAIGLADRFRYWSGASGRRYLFSSVAADTLDDLAEAVLLIVVEPDGEAAHGEPRLVWIGDIDRDGVRHGRSLGPIPTERTRCWAHFLARDEEARAAILADLAGS